MFRSRTQRYLQRILSLSIPHYKIPSNFIHLISIRSQVTYMMDVKIDPGFDYDQFEIQGEPIVTWEAENNTYYLMLMMGIRKETSSR